MLSATGQDAQLDDSLFGVRGQVLELYVVVVARHHVFTTRRCRRCTEGSARFGGPLAKVPSQRASATGRVTAEAPGRTRGSTANVNFAYDDHAVALGKSRDAWTVPRFLHEYRPRSPDMSAPRRTRARCHRLITPRTTSTSPRLATPSEALAQAVASSVVGQWQDGPL